MSWIVSKLDWSPNDFINYDDFNRIENNVQEVAAYLNSIQYSVPILAIVVDRNYSWIDFISSINRIEQNIETIRTSFITPGGYGPAKTWSAGKGFSFEDANRLERNLALLLNLGMLVYESFVYCGSFICGQALPLSQAIHFRRYADLETMTFDQVETYSWDEIELL